MAKKVSKRKKRKFLKFLFSLIIIVIILLIAYYFKGELSDSSSASDELSSSEVLSSNDIPSEDLSSIEDSNSIQETPSDSHEHVENVIYDNFQIHFLELGVYNTGDSTYIKAGDTDILIDAGATMASTSTLINYIDNYCTDGVLEYVITTHSHTDHYAGMFGSKKSSKNFKGETVERTGLMYYYDIETIIDFSQTTQSATATNYMNYKNAVEYAKTQGAVRYSAEQCFNETDGAKRQYVLDEENNITMDILYNIYYFEKSSDENDHSVCTMFNYNGHHFMLTGDLEKEGEEAMAAYYDKSTPEKTLPHVDLFKAGHHGSPTSSNDCLLSLITPDICCVCCCAGSSEYTTNNDNTFPSQDFIDRIATYTDKVYVTSVLDNNESRKQGEQIFKSLNGNIIVSCNGKNTSVKCSNNDTILKDSEWFNEEIYVKVSSKGVNQICSGNKKPDYYIESDEDVIKITRRIWPNS